MPSASTATTAATLTIAILGWSRLVPGELGAATPSRAATLPGAALAVVEEVPGGNAELRRALLGRLEPVGRFDRDSLIATSVSDGHVIAGAALEQRDAGSEAIGYLFLVGQGSWRGGDRLADGVYVVRRGPSRKTVELVDQQGRVAATIPVDWPTGEGGAALPGPWSRTYRAILKALIP